MAKVKVYKSIEDAIKDGCCENELTIKNGVYQCICSELNKKEEKAPKKTKELKIDKESK